VCAVCHEETQIHNREESQWIILVIMTTDFLHEYNVSCVALCVTKWQRRTLNAP